MTTPFPQPTGTSLRNSGSSGSFLQQLLDEISGRDIRTLLHTRSAPQDMPKLQPSHDASKRHCSVWVGGASIAQDAREKLRAVDEARLYKRFTRNTQDTPSSYKPSSRLLSWPICPASASTSRIAKRLGRGELDISDSSQRLFSRQRTRGAIPGGVEPPCPRPKDDEVCLPSSSFIAESLWSSNDVDEADSPPTCYDTHSDPSSIPSDTEAPTSAVTTASTEATIVSDETWSPRETARGSSLRKRARSRPASPKMLPKKMRTMTLPETQSRKATRSETTSILLGPTGSDNRCLIRTPTFVERATTLEGLTRPIEPHALPELSSFRPKIATSQGPPPQPSTPVRTTARRASIFQQDERPAPAETPSFARPLHLIDTDISIYKYDHGEEWKVNPLCLYCFRRHGSFNRILTHGYEVCGREEMLNSHYWEPALNPYT